jgi:hypothetical protein
MSVADHIVLSEIKTQTGIADGFLDVKREKAGDSSEGGKTIAAVGFAIASFFSLVLARLLRSTLEQIYTPLQGTRIRGFMLCTGFPIIACQIIICLYSLSYPFTHSSLSIILFSST